MEARLYCKECGYVWDYRGIRKKGQMVTCPACGKRIKALKVEDSVEAEDD